MNDKVTVTTPEYTSIEVVISVLDTHLVWANGARTEVYCQGPLLGWTRQWDKVRDGYVLIPIVERDHTLEEVEWAPGLYLIDADRCNHDVSDREVTDEWVRGLVREKAHGAQHGEG